MAPTDFLACLALCFVFLCLSNEIRHLMFLAQILRQLCLTNFVRLQFHCHTRPGHSLNCFRCAASAVCGSNWQLAMDEDKTLIYQAFKSQSKHIQRSARCDWGRSNRRGVHKSGDRMRGDHAAGISINRTLNGLTCRRRLLIQSYPTPFRLRLLNKFACIMSTK